MKAAVSYNSFVLKTRMPELRREHGITQSGLAEAIGVTRETIVRIESGRVNPTLKIAFDIAAVLHARIEDIFSFEESC